MIDLLEIGERARTGPKMEENSWNLGLFKKMESLTKEYRLTRPKELTIFSSDEEMAQRAFDAGVEFLSTTGVYCSTTHRTIALSEDEIVEAIREIPGEVIVGQGRDSRVIRKREIEDPRPPNVVGGLHAPYPENLLDLVPKNFAQIPRSDMIESFNLVTIDGRDVIGPALEAYAARSAVAHMREGVRKAGRPGMAISYYPISTGVHSMLAPMDPEYCLRRTDGVLLSVLPDVKTDYDSITSAVVYEDYGSYKFNGGPDVFIGGFCGGSEGAVVESIVRAIAAWIIYRDDIQEAGTFFRMGPGDPVVSPPLWESSIVHHALCGNSDIIRFSSMSFVGFEPCTDFCLYEKAITSIRAVMDGFNIYISRAFAQNRGQTPLEVEFMVEVSDAILKGKFKREEASQVIDKLLKKLVGKPIPEGKSITQCYDLVRHKPTKEYEAIYRSVKEELRSMGLEFEY